MIKVNCNNNDQYDICSTNEPEETPQQLYIKTEEMEQIMNRPLNLMQILQAYYADIYYMLNDMCKIFTDNKIYSPATDQFKSAMFIYMKSDFFDNRYDSAFKDKCRQVYNSINNFKDDIEKNDFFKLLNLCKSVDYMTDVNAKRLALSCSTINEYNMRIDKIRKCVKRADMFER